MGVAFLTKPLENSDRRDEAHCSGEKLGEPLVVGYLRFGADHAEIPASFGHSTNSGYDRPLFWLHHGRPAYHGWSVGSCT